MKNVFGVSVGLLAGIALGSILIWGLNRVMEAAYQEGRCRAVCHMWTLYGSDIQAAMGECECSK